MGADHEYQKRQFVDMGFLCPGPLADYVCRPGRSRRQMFWGVGKAMTAQKYPKTLSPELKQLFEENFPAVVDAMGKEGRALKIHFCDDQLQEIYRESARYFARYQPIYLGKKIKPTTWIYLCVRYAVGHTLGKWTRDRRRERKLTRVPLLESRLPSVPPTVYHECNTKRLSDLVDTLPPNFRGPIRRIYFDGVSASDHARELGLTRERVRQRCQAGFEIMKRRAPWLWDLIEGTK